jgi:hypothetical protein
MAGCRWLSIGLVDEVAELMAACDTELGVGAVQVGGDGAGGQEQLVGDLSVGQATACQDHDLAMSRSTRTGYWRGASMGVAVAEAPARGRRPGRLSTGETAHEGTEGGDCQMSAEAGAPISTYFRVRDGVRVRFADTRAASDSTVPATSRRHLGA